MILKMGVCIAINNFGTLFFADDWKYIQIIVMWPTFGFLLIDPIESVL